MKSDKSQKSVSSPKNDDLSNEIDAALDGVNLQDLDARGGAPSARGPASTQDRNVKRGVIAGISGDDVIVELGPRMQGVISLREFETPPTIGATMEFTLRGREDELWMLSRREQQALAAWEDVQPGSLVKARVTGQNTGGLELKVGPLSAFMPASQVSLGREDNLAQFLTQTLTCKVLEVDRDKKRIVLSRRAVLEVERGETLREAPGKYAVGAVLRGKITRVEAFGAFVDLGGGIEGMVHVSNLSRRRIEKPSDFVSQGQDVQVQVLEIKEGGKRIALGMKQLEPDPWREVAGRYAPDSVVTGKVTRVNEFGAFVELEPGIEGLVHVSQLAKERVRRAVDVVKPGQELTVRVVSVEPARQRVSLSRMDSRGAMLGSEESVDSSVIDEAMRQSNTEPLRTNLGSLFKKAIRNDG